MDMIERVARIIAVNEGFAPDDTTDVGFRVEGIPVWKSYERTARAAIEAMRKPTEEMKRCSEEVHWGYSCHVCGGLTEGWYAMIDAALIAPSPNTQNSETPKETAAASSNTQPK